MKIMIGHTEEISRDGRKDWAKAEVTVDETDLLRLLVECGSTTPDADSARLTTGEAFTALENQAQGLLLVQLATRYPREYPITEVRDQIEKYVTAARTKLAKKITRVEELGEADSD